MTKDAPPRDSAPAEAQEDDDAREDPAPRNTLVPSFDVATFARAVDGPSARPARVTVTNEVELEEARMASMQSSMPPPRSRIKSEAEVEIGIAEVDLDDSLESVRVRMASSPDARIRIEVHSLGDPEEVLGDLARTPSLLVSGSEVPSLGLDHHSGFMLALVDGALNYETILDVCGMSRAEALGVLATLARRGVIGVKK